eukprot:TRINITY_DN70351_c0_g1_i1.p1 TRINITY_DN70351_c0_g1~~TRINITY_DN70351_c0_g1_i1.p1  ORF type:complete len:911 (+),score=292.03 TRINITY_DN70351_c0_g1_i1:80-2734(+)
MARSKKDDQDPYERAAEMVWENAKYLLIFAGPQFAEDSGRQPFASEFCTPVLVEKANKFMGFWGEYYNRYVHEKSGHEGFSILYKWRSQFFDPYQQDLRARAKPKKKGDEEEPGTLLPRCYVVTCNIDGWFGRAGFDPEREMYEIWGNIATWQCSGLPDREPCTQQTWVIARNFRFAVDGPPAHSDPRNEKKEAAAFQEITDVRDNQETPEGSAVDSEEDAETVPPGGLRGSERDYIAERLRRATVLRCCPSLQHRPERYPDHFAGYPRHSGEKPTLRLGLRSERQAPPPAAAPAPAAAEPEEGVESPATAPDSPPQSAPTPPSAAAPPPAPPEPPRGQPYLPLSTFSHEQQHVRALGRGEYAHLVGEFSIGAPSLRDEKLLLNQVLPWLVQRRRVTKKNYEKQQTFFNHFNSTTDARRNERQKHVWYNLSVRIIDDDKEEAEAADSASSSDDDEACYRPTGVTSPSASPSAAVGSGMAAARSAGQAAQGSAADQRDGDPSGVDPSEWFQGKRSRYYFSNVPPCDCFVDPDKHYHDVVQVPVEALREPQLPLRGRVSCVVEMIVGPKPEPEKPKPKGKGKAAAAEEQHEYSSVPIPHPFRRTMWQMVGRIDTAHLGDLRAGTGGRGGRWARTGDDEGEGGEDFAEHILEASARTRGACTVAGAHIFKIGVSPAQPRRIRYFEWETPCEEDEPSANPLDAATVRRRAPRQTKEALKAGAPSTAHFGVTGQRQRPGTRPAPNHQLCQECHGLARPRVRMVPRDNPRGKDNTMVPIPTRPFQDWQKLVLKDLSGGGTGSDNKGILILEMGCLRKMDPVRREADKLWKKCKSNPKNCYIRISEFDLETKKKGAGGDSENYLIMPLGEPKEALKRIDRHINQRLNKEKR